MKLGAFDCLRKPVSLERMSWVVRNAIEQHRLQRQVADLLRVVGDAGIRGRVGSSLVTLELHRSIERLGASHVSVLIDGESGMGREFVARAIHDASERAGQAFVAVNASALPKAVQEIEFFGHEEGALTGDQELRHGSIERAHAGTLFLDEVAELSASLQAALCRVFREPTFKRIGGSEEIESDFRVVAATHRDLMAAVAANEFREDLYCRLEVVHLAPLRTRTFPSWHRSLCTRWCARPE